MITKTEDGVYEVVYPDVGDYVLTCVVTSMEKLVGKGEYFVSVDKGEMRERESERERERANDRQR